MSKLTRNFSSQSFIHEQGRNLTQLSPAKQVRSEYDRHSYLPGYEPIGESFDSFKVSKLKTKKK